MDKGRILEGSDPTLPLPLLVATVSGWGLTAAWPCTRWFLILGPPGPRTPGRLRRRGGSAARRQKAGVASDRAGSAASRGDAPVRLRVRLPPAFTPLPHSSPFGAAGVRTQAGCPLHQPEPPSSLTACAQGGGEGGAWRPRPNGAARWAAGGRGSRLRPRHVARAAALPKPPAGGGEGWPTRREQKNNRREPPAPRTRRANGRDSDRSL